MHKNIIDWLINNEKNHWLPYWRSHIYSTCTERFGALNHRGTQLQHLHLHCFSLREQKIWESSLNAPRPRILLSKPFSSHGLVHTAEGKEWAQIRALARHNLCLVNLSKSADTAYSNEFSETDLDTMTLITHWQLSSKEGINIISIAL